MLESAERSYTDVADLNTQRHGGWFGSGVCDQRTLNYRLYAGAIGAGNNYGFHAWNQELDDSQRNQIGAGGDGKQGDVVAGHLLKVPAQS